MDNCCGCGEGSPPGGGCRVSAAAVVPWCGFPPLNLGPTDEMLTMYRTKTTVYHFWSTDCQPPVAQTVTTVDQYIGETTCQTVGSFADQCGEFFHTTAVPCFATATVINDRSGYASENCACLPRESSLSELLFGTGPYDVSEEKTATTDVVTYTPNGDSPYPGLVVTITTTLSDEFSRATAIANCQALLDLVDLSNCTTTYPSGVPPEGTTKITCCPPDDTGGEFGITVQRYCLGSDDDPTTCYVATGVEPTAYCIVYPGPLGAIVMNKVRIIGATGLCYTGVTLTYPGGVQTESAPSCVLANDGFPHTLELGPAGVPFIDFPGDPLGLGGCC